MESATRVQASDRLRFALRSPAAVPLALVAVLVTSVQLLPKGMPWGLYGSGLVFGSHTALVAVGLLLVFRSDRIINFAQVQLGAVGGILFYEIVTHNQLARWASQICPGCLPRNPRLAPAWLQYLNFSFALVAALGVSAVVSLAVYGLVIRRFRNAPPLVATVGTLGVAQVLTFAVEKLPTAFGDRAGVVAGLARPPHDVTLTWSPVVLHVGEIATVLVAVAIFGGLAVFMRRSKAGIAVRASAENPERAATLGMNGTLVAAIVWMVAGLVSGLTAVLTAMTTGPTSLTGSGTQALMRTLAAAVLAGMASFPLAVVASIGIAVFDQGFLWSFGNGIMVDALVFAVIVAVLLLRRSRSGRIDPEASSWRAARESRPIPAELRSLPVMTRWIRGAVVAAAALLLSFPWVMSPSDTSQGSIMLIFGMVGVSLLMLTGWAGQISLGQFAFAAVGGFVVSLLGGRAGWPIFVAVPAAALAGAAVAVFVGLPALRIRGLYLAVTTLGFAVVTTNVLLSERFGGSLIPDTIDRPVLVGLDTGDERVFYYLSLLALAGCVTAVVGMRRSRTGRALIACRDNERAAQALGINLVRARLEAFAASGLIASFAGAVFAYHQQGVHVGNYAPEASLTMFLMVVIGGLGSVAGPLLGAFFVGGLTIFLREGVAVTTAVAALLLLVFVPGGMSQIVYSIRDGFLRRLAEQHRIVVPSLLADVRVEAGGGFRAPIAPKLLPTGATEFVPVRYRLPYNRPPAAKSPAEVVR